ncbi:hypothetical protein HII36_40905, partial [Nonomuraea sp. NN258]|nr:hypothetical protein [Nonomuraea antri]
MSTTLVTRAPAGRPIPPSRHARRGPRLWWLLAIGWVLQVAVRLWLFRYHAGPVANPDETGYLVAARWLAGGPSADLSGSTFYQGGYALLLVPVFWVTSDPAAAYRLVVVVGSMASAAAFPLAFALLRRLGTGRRTALAAAFAAGFSPALLLFSGLALADAVLPAVVLGWLVAVHDLARHGSTRAGVAAGALAAYAMAVHLRGTVIVAVFALVVIALMARGRMPVRGGLVSLGVVGVGAAAGKALNAVLSAELYPGGPRDLSGLLVDRVTSLDG